MQPNEGVVKKRSWFYIPLGEVERISLRTLIIGIQMLAAVYGIYLYGGRVTRRTLAVAVLGTLLASIVTGIFGRWRRPPWYERQRAKFQAIGIILTLVFVGLVLGWGHSAFRKLDSRDQFARIFEGLNKYALEQGEYPQRIEDLPASHFGRIKFSALEGTLTYIPQQESKRGLLVWNCPGLFEEHDGMSILLVYVPPELKPSKLK